MNKHNAIESTIRQMSSNTNTHNTYNTYQFQRPQTAEAGVNVHMDDNIDREHARAAMEVDTHHTRQQEKENRTPTQL